MSNNIFLPSNDERKGEMNIDDKVFSKWGKNPSKKCIYY